MRSPSSQSLCRTQSVFPSSPNSCTSRMSTHCSTHSSPSSWQVAYPTTSLSTVLTSLYFQPPCLCQQPPKPLRDPCRANHSAESERFPFLTQFLYLKNVHLQFDAFLSLILASSIPDDLDQPSRSELYDATSCQPGSEGHRLWRNASALGISNIDLQLGFDLA